MLNVAVFADRGSEIGFGHVSRCLALLGAWEEIGASVNLVVPPGNGVGTNGVPSRADAVILDWIRAKSFRELPHDKYDVVVVDSYRFNSSQAQRLRRLASQAAWFDDTNRINYGEGYLIDGALTPILRQRMPGLTPLLGTRYAALRKPFWDLGTRKYRDQIESVVITLGGDGFSELSHAIASALGKELSTASITVLDNISIPKRRNIASPGRVDDHRMVELLLNADLVVCGGGQILIEAARVGVPAVTIQTADNQKTNIKGWSEVGFAVSAGNIGDEHLIDTIVDQVAGFRDTERRKKVGNIGQSLIDGQGARRIVRAIGGYVDEQIIITPGGLKLTPFIKMSREGINRIWEWRNHPNVRSSMVNDDVLLLHTHEQFVENLKLDSAKAYYEVSDGKTGIGVLNLTSINHRNRTAELGLYKSPDLPLDRKVGMLLMRALHFVAREHYDLDKLTLKVKNQNDRAINLYKRSGYTIDGQDEKWIYMSRYLTNEY